eukprot:13420575-Alexandrium_andersonii.AAC.1
MHPWHVHPRRLTQSASVFRRSCYFEASSVTQAWHQAAVHGHIEQLRVEHSTTERAATSCAAWLRDPWRRTCLLYTSPSPRD